MMTYVLNTNAGSVHLLPLFLFVLLCFSKNTNKNSGRRCTLPAFMLKPGLQQSLLGTSSRSAQNIVASVLGKLRSYSGQAATCE